MVQINLLPWREQELKEKQKKFLILLGYLLIFTLFILFIIHLYLAALLSSQLDRNDYLSSQLKIEQQALEQLYNNKQKLLTLDAQIHFIFNMQRISYQAVSFLSELTRIVPSGVWLDEINRQGSVLSIEGNAESDSQVTIFMKNIYKSSVFSQPVLTEISAKESNASQRKQFRLNVHGKEEKPI